MAALGLVGFIVGVAMSLAPNTVVDQIMGIVFSAVGLFLIARAYHIAQR